MLSGGVLCCFNTCWGPSFCQMLHSSTYFGQLYNVFGSKFTPFGHTRVFLKSRIFTKKTSLVKFMVLFKLQKSTRDVKMKYHTKSSSDQIKTDGVEYTHILADLHAVILGVGGAHVSKAVAECWGRVSIPKPPPTRGTSRSPPAVAVILSPDARFVPPPARIPCGCPAQCTAYRSIPLVSFSDFMLHSLYLKWDVDFSRRTHLHPPQARYRDDVELGGRYPQGVSRPIRAHDASASVPD